MFLSTKLKLTAFVAALLVVMTAIWHFAFIGFTNDSGLCLILTIVVASFGFDAIKYLEEYCLAKPNRPITKQQRIARIAMKVIFYLVMMNTSATFSVKDVIIKHPPTFIIELVTLALWYFVYSVIQLEFEKRTQKAQ